MLRPGQQLAKAARPEDDQVGRAPRPDAAVAGKLHGSCRRAANTPGPLSIGPVQVCQPATLLKSTTLPLSSQAVEMCWWFGRSRPAGWKATGTCLRDVLVLRIQEASWHMLLGYSMKDLPRAKTALDLHGNLPAAFLLCGGLHSCSLMCATGRDHRR